MRSANSATFISWETVGGSWRITSPTGHLLEYVRLVFLMDAQAASRQLLRHDRFLHESSRDAAGDDADQHQWQNRVVVAGDFKGKDDKSERRVGGRSEHGPHGDQGERRRSQMRTRE